MERQKEKMEQVQYLRQKLSSFPPDADLKQIAYTKYELGKLIEYDDLPSAKELFEDVLKEAKLLDDPHLLGRALYRLGKHYEILGYRQRDKSFQEREKLFEKALVFFKNSLDSFEQTQDLIRQGHLLQCKADLAKTLGNFQLASESLEKRISLLERSKDSHKLTFALNNLSYIYRLQGKYYSAVQGYLKSQRLSKKAGNKQGIAFAINNRAIIMTLKGKYRDALKLYNRSIDIAKTYNGQKDIAYSLGGIGWVYRKQGKTNEALKTYLQSLKYFESAKASKPVNIYLAIADLLIFQYPDNNVLPDALNYIEKACNVSYQHTDLIRCQAAEANYYLARYKKFHQMEDFQNAEEMYTEILANSSFFEVTLQVYLGLSTLFLQKYKHLNQLEDFENAKSYLQKTQRLAKKAFIYPTLVASLNTQAMLFVIEFNFETALKKVRQALKLAQEMKLYHDAKMSLNLLSQLEIQQKAANLYDTLEGAQKTQSAETEITIDDALSYLEEIKKFVMQN